MKKKDNYTTNALFSMLISGIIIIFALSNGMTGGTTLIAGLIGFFGTSIFFTLEDIRGNQ